MSSNFSAFGKCLIVPETYEQNAMSDAIEESIAATLPDIPGLDAATTPEARCAILSEAATHSRNAFIARFGSAFDAAPLLAPSRFKPAETPVLSAPLPVHAVAAA